MGKENRQILSAVCTWL